MRRISVLTTTLFMGAALSLACSSDAQRGTPPPSFTSETPVTPEPELEQPATDTPGNTATGDLDPNLPLEPEAPAAMEPEPAAEPLPEPPPAPQFLPEPVPAEPRLRDAAAASERLVGVAVQARLLNDAAYRGRAAEFNVLTAENEMKWSSTERQPGVYTFQGADRIVAFAEANGMKVRGHTLVWYQQLPAWVSALETPEAVRAAMLGHIQGVMTHFKGHVYAWDVVNEAWADGGAELRPSVFLEQLGAGYIDEAFIAARAADPDAKLFYNDYGTEGNSRKANQVYDMVSGMLERGVPIDGVGLQMHINQNDSNPSAAQLVANLQRLVDLGLEVNITELDIASCGNGGTDALLQAQAQRAAAVANACMGQARCSALTVWGVADPYSWRDDCNGGGDPLPLLFNAAYEKKPVYDAVFRALSGQ
jgi:endo-1,4-beta-xylanase